MAGINKTKRWSTDLQLIRASKGWRQGWTAEVKTKKLQNSKKQRNKSTKKAWTEAPFMNRPEFVNAPYPTRSQKSWSVHQTKTDPNRQPPSQRITASHFSPDMLQKEKRCTNLTARGHPPPQSMNSTWALMSVRGLYFLLEKYWQCGDKSHHNKEMHTLFNSILTYKKLFSTSL